MTPTMESRAVRTWVLESPEFSETFATNSALFMSLTPPGCCFKPRLKQHPSRAKPQARIMPRPGGVSNADRAGPTSDAP